MIEMLSNSDEYWREIARLRQERIDSLEKAVGLFLASKGIMMEVGSTLDQMMVKFEKLDTLRASEAKQNKILLRRANRKVKFWKTTAITTTVAGAGAIIYYRFIWSKLQ